MAIYAKATKTSLTKFLRSKGFDVPSIYAVDFRPAKYSFWMDWRDGEGTFHSCWYSMVGGAPYCTVDGEAVKITLAEMMRYGLYEKKIKKPLPVRVHRQRLRCGFHHEDNVIIPHPRIFYKRGCELEARSEAGQLGGHSG